MRAAGWYVMQVSGGREQRLCELIERTSAQQDLLSDEDDYHLVEECFSPRYRTRLKFGGQWQDVEKPLLPGYVVVVTRHPNALSRWLRKVPEFTRLLAMGESFVPLRDDERAWIDEWTTYGDRTVPISIAYRKGDDLVVTEGPLKGHEGKIVRVIRKKCQAQVALHVDGKRITTTVGLAIVPRSESDSDTTE